MNFRQLLCTTAIVSAAFAVPAFAQDDSTAVDELVVTGSQVALPDAYAGGQVAVGGRVGLFGAQDQMDTPFSFTAYTEDLARNQQARSVADVLQNDPVVRVAKGFGNFQELYVIRGFPVYSDDMSYNGLYGILPRQFVAAELLERVEVFHGATTFLNGAAPGGSGVGGAFNLVPKRAPADGLTSVTAGWETGGALYGAADIARRFGANDAFGARLNLVQRGGETSVHNQERDLSVVALGLDYQGERLRFSADAGFQDHRIDDPRPSVTPTGDIPLPPEASTNYAQPWTYTDENQLFGVVRGEFDIAPGVTAWAAVGGREGEEQNVLANPSSNAAGVTSAYRFDNAREDSVFSADAGISGNFETGAVWHRIVASGSTLTLKSRNAYAFSNFAGFAGDLYQPFPVAPPAANFFVGGDMANPHVTERVDNSSFALADQLGFLDGALLVTVGARYQSIETETFDYNTGASFGGYKDSAVTPALGLVYKPNDKVSLYANYAQALQPGQIAPATSGGVPVINAGEVLAPFTSQQYEAGVKFDGGDFGGTVSLFSTSKPSAYVQNNVFSDFGKQHHTGIEITAYGEPVEGLRVLGGATFLNPKLSRTAGGANDDNDPIGVPERQFNANVEWDVPTIEGLTLEGRAIHTGSQYANIANTVELESWTRLDAGVRYATDVGGRGVVFRARVENLTDHSYWASVGGYPGANYLVLGTPRTFSLSAQVDF